MSQTSTARHTEFKLLRYFTSASLVAFLVAAALLGYVFRALSIDSIVKGYERQHVNLAQVISNEMWDDAFGPLAMAVAGKSVAEIQATPQIPRIHRKVVMLLSGSKIFKIKVYDLRGMTIYSSETKQIGEDKSANAGVIDALRGLNSSELSHRNRFSAFEGEVLDRDLIETYVPRLDPASGKVIGILEIYGDATDVLADIGKRQWIMVLSVIALLSLLYLALYAIVQNAQKHIAEETQQREMAQQALASSEERWKFALDGSDAGVWDRNLQTGEVVYSRRYREIYGYGEDQLIDHWETWEDRVHPDDLPLVTADREAYLTGKTETYSNERRMRCQDGSWKWILSRGMVVSRDAQGRPVRMIGTHTDISERKAAQQRLQMLAHFDLLTGLPNRGLFSDRLRHGLAKARRDKTGLALMMIDLDEFKPVNDLYGHQIGDLLLKEVATRMLACVRRETDTVARLGGDEFVVILSEVEQARDATTVAETIRDALHQTFDIGGRLINISSCIGVAIFPEHGPDEALLIKSADVAMYRAKENGRNRVELA
ncbi:MAG: diguanylate cyclase [Comamonadaceae bacterium]|nr:MAG: diguanylate cyclase [Comamonadaceae bacterium]